MLKELPRATLESLRDLAASAVDYSGRLLRHPRATATEVRDVIESLQDLLASDVEPSPLLSGRSLSRRVMWIELSLSELKRASHAVGGSVTDGFLAALCGVLRHYHETLGMPVDVIPIAIPINIRAADDVGGNHITGMLLEAPVGQPDLARRVREIHAQVQRGRDRAHIDVTGIAAQLVGYLPPVLIERIMKALPLPDLQASNLPGATEDLFLAGARVEKTIGIGPVPNMSMMVGCTAHRDACAITVTYDPAAIQEAKLFETCLEKGFAELLDRAPEGDASPRGGLA
jgi:diacylglycerol O-acyltransferase